MTKTTFYAMAQRGALFAFPFFTFISLIAKAGDLDEIGANLLHATTTDLNGSGGTGRGAGRHQHI
jgi:hypothetical protein